MYIYLQENDDSDIIIGYRGLYFQEIDDSGVIGVEADAL